MKQTTKRFLLWSQKYTKTDMLYLTKGGFWLSLSKIISIAASFGSSVAFANLFPESTYGTYRYVLSIASLLTIPTLQGINVALTRAIAAGKDISYLHPMLVKMKWGSLGGLASLGLAGYYFFAGNETFVIAFLIVAIFIPFMDSFHVYAAILNGQKKFNVLAKDEIVVRTSTALLVIVLVFFTEHVLLIIFTYFFSTTLLRYLFLKHSVPDMHKDAQKDNQLILYGKHISVMGILSKIGAQADKILLFHYAGSTALAGFYLALMPFKQTQSFLKGITTLAIPKFASSSPEVLKRTLPGKLLRLYFLLVPIVIVYYFVAPYMFSYLYPQYLDSVIISQILMLQILFFPASPIQHAIEAQGHKGKLYVSSSTYAILRIVSLALLVPAFGVYGVLAAVIGTNIIISFFLLILFYRL